MDESRALIVTLEIPKLFPGYEAALHWPIFWRAVVDRLIDRGLLAHSLRVLFMEHPDHLVAGVALLRYGFAERIFRERTRLGYGPLDDVELAATLDAPCPSFDAREHGRLVTEMYKSISKVSGGESGVEVFGRFIEEADLLARGKVTFREWLTLPYTSAVIIEAMALRLDETYIPPGEDDGVAMIRGMMRDAFPQWFTLKRHVEREYRLIQYALHSRPEDQELLQNRAAIRTVAKTIADHSIEDFVGLMCDRRADFRALFRLPYHQR